MALQFMYENEWVLADNPYTYNIQNFQLDTAWFLIILGLVTAHFIAYSYQSYNSCKQQ